MKDSVFKCENRLISANLREERTQNGWRFGTRRAHRPLRLRVYFLNRRSKASRASLALRGGGVFAPGTGARPLPGICADDASRATVTRGENSVHTFAWSFKGMRTGIGLLHWKRVEGSKWEHCLQQWSAVPHLGHLPSKDAVSGSSVVEQL